MNMCKCRFIGVAVMLLIIGSVSQLRGQEVEREDANPRAEHLSHELEPFAVEQAQILEKLKDVEQRQRRQVKALNDYKKATDKRLEEVGERIAAGVDSLERQLRSLDSLVEQKRVLLQHGVDEVKQQTSSTQASLSKRSLYLGLSGLLLFFALLGIFLWMRHRFTRSRFSLDEVRNAQERLQEVQRKMQEESILLDNKMLELIENQLRASKDQGGGREEDHSLTLKVADEIVRIELNLSRMDSNVKGYKQLQKALQRMKDNFLANGYEIVDMLGKPYNEGMKVIANFVADETLGDGVQIITGITKPQINYKGKMIQSAQITVSQNI